MQKISTKQASGKNIFEGQLTIGVDLGDRSSAYCVLNEAGTSRLAGDNACYQQLACLPYSSCYCERQLISGLRGIGRLEVRAGFRRRGRSWPRAWHSKFSPSRCLPKAWPTARRRTAH